MEVEYSEGVVRAVDAAKTTVRVRTPTWEPGATGPPLTRSVDEVLSGRTTSLRFPGSFVAIVDLDAGETTTLGSREGPVEFPAGRYQLRVDSPLRAYVRADGPLTVSRPDHAWTDIDFAEPTPVTLGFRSRVESPPDTLVVPETPQGVATALSALPVAFRTPTADRSFASMRTHPPLVEFGDGVEIPDAVAAGRTDTGVELVVPPSLSYLIPAASLVHYLGAEVTVEPDANPALRAAGETFELGAGRAFEERCNSLLRRTFWLDCLVRTAGPHDAAVRQAAVLEELDLDPHGLYDAPVGERLAAYVEAAFDPVADRLPDWHLSMYVEPSYEHVRSLPYLVGNVPLLYSPRTESLTDRARMESSLDDFYRGADDAASVELQRAELGPSRYHGWLAGDIPLDTFKTLSAAYDNRPGYLTQADEAISVVTVLNEAEMGDEYEEALSVYRERASKLDIDVGIRESVTTAELARIFESRNDLVHYIGHCEAGGLKCPDGTLSVSSIDESRAQTFFLNACGSYYEGLELVRKGSVAGAVTFQKVLDGDAAKVGAMFARLVVHGYSIERALDRSRRRVIMGKDYAVVGDGTHNIAQKEGAQGEARLEQLDDGRFELTYGIKPLRHWGGRMKVHAVGDDTYDLIGAERRYELSRDALRDFLQKGGFPVVYGGDIHWSTELVDRL